MNDMLIIVGSISIVIGVQYYFVMLHIKDTREILIKKQDAIMVKLIELKFR